MKCIVALLFALSLLSVEAFRSFDTPNGDQLLTASLLRAVVNRMNDYPHSKSFVDLNQQSLPIRTRLSPTKDEDEELYADVDEQLGMVPSLRDNEYLQHSSLWGYQYMAGGAGEGKQNLKPNGNIPNKNEVKTDAVLPAYCNPPNPCPLGYTEIDGCIQDFDNTASFSRDYQALQKCMCDSEHMFDCPSARDFSYENDLELEQMVRRYQQLGRAQKSFVSKKMGGKNGNNPYLKGELLPIAAKKGINVQF